MKINIVNTEEYGTIYDLRDGNYGELIHYDRVEDMIMESIMIAEWNGPVSLVEYFKDYLDVYVTHNKKNSDGNIYLEDVIRILEDSRHYLNKNSYYAHEGLENGYVTFDEVEHYFDAIEYLLIQNRFGYLKWESMCG